MMAKNWSYQVRNESETCSVMSDSLQPQGLYSAWNSPGQNNGVSSLSLLQGIFLTQGSNPGLPYCSGFFTSWLFLFHSKVWSEHTALGGTKLKQLRQLSGESSHHWPSFRKLELQDQCFAKCDARTTCIRILQWCFWNYRILGSTPDLLNLNQ